MAKSVSTQAVSTTATWTPIVTLDLETASTKAFEEAVAKIKAHAEANPPAPVDIKNLVRIDGPLSSMTVTPQIAEQCLLNNAGNRKVGLGQVIRYADQMKAGSWRMAQPFLFNDQGQLEDAQHRAWAVYLSGVTIETTVTVVPKTENLFAILDSGKIRSAADAIYTAGNNGQSTNIAGAIALLWRYGNNALSVMAKQPKIRALYNEEILEYLDAHEKIKDVAHLLAGSHGKAVKVIKNGGVAVAFAYLVCEEFDDVVLNDFLAPLGTGARLDELSPILGLRNRLTSAADEGSESGLKAPQRFALCIKAFNMWRAGHLVSRSKGLFLRDNEKFPRIDGNSQLPLAAE